MTDSTKPGFDLSDAALLASSIHSQLLARRRATLEHDIKNVLHGLMSGTELLGKSLTMTSARITPAECLNLLQQQLARAQTTLHHLLDEIAPPRQEAVAMNLGELIGECMHALRHQLQMLDVQTAIEKNLRVYVTHARFKDALLGILLDSIDRMPARARLALRAERTVDDQVLVVIQHTQTAALPTSLVPTIATMVAAYGARVTVEENATERSVHFYMPSAADPFAAESVPVQLLILDANRDAADSLAMLAQLEGLGAEAAYDVATAVERIRDGSHRCVLVDLDGSVDSGAFVRTIRSRSGEQPRIIGLSHSQGDAVDGFDAYLRKPVDVAELRRSLT